ncbi:SDR family NAD(P)-dependent oxidoreductase [Paenibacillus sp. FSL H8-0034]|uniref:SDR family NAD(P)-dependent oxidoreductase n=1 Tax=Paenibacillus sp. FSL H8-0034 TaxID=2954671 RepID=UPI0030FBC519
MEAKKGTWSIKGKYVIITGATSGIGLAAAKELLKRGAILGIVARNRAKAEATVVTLKAAAGNDAKVDIFLADMASQQSIRDAAKDIQNRWARLDVLINNAGAMFVKHLTTEDGIEMTWAVNHMAPFLLTKLLLNKLKGSGHGRIITTASHGHKMARNGIGFDDLSGRKYYRFPHLLIGGPNFRYGETKLANIMFTAELERRLEGFGVSAACFDPGLVATNFNQDNGLLARMTMAVMKQFSRTQEKGAETLVWLADSDEMSLSSGHYYKDMQRIIPSGQAQDPAAAKRLWEMSENQL